MDALGTLRLLEAIRFLGMEEKTRFYQASLELYGKVRDAPDGADPILPRSLMENQALRVLITVNYRESYGMFACNGIMLNHESPRRGETFVTRKSLGHSLI